MTRSADVPPAAPERKPAVTIRAELPPPAEGNEDARAEERKLSLTQLKNDRYQQQNEHFQAEHNARLGLLRKLYYLICLWLAFVAAVVLLSGFLGSATGNRFVVSDNVLLAILGVTTVNVLGTFLVAANYVFPKDAGWMKETHRSYPRATRPTGPNRVPPPGDPG